MTRIPPQNLDAERCVLGCLMLDKERMYSGRILHILKEDDFYREDHQIIYKLARSFMLRNADGLDLIIISDELKKSGKLKEVGGLDYIVKIIESVPSFANAMYYTKIVKESSIRRKFIRLGVSLTNDAYGDEKDIDDLITNLRRGAKRVIDEKLLINKENSYTMETAIMAAGDYSNKLLRNEVIIIDTPWPNLNAAFGGSGITPGTVALLISKTGVGKSWMSYQLALHNAEQGRKVFILNTEMTQAMYATRFMSILSGNPEISSMTLPTVQHEVQLEYGEYLASLPIEVTPKQSFDLDIAFDIIKDKVSDGAKLIIVDHINDLQCKEKWKSLPDLANRFSDLAQQHLIVIILVSHIKPGDKEQIANSNQIEFIVDWCWTIKKFEKSHTSIVRGLSGYECDEREETHQHAIYLRKMRFGSSDYSIAMRLSCECGRFGYTDLGEIVKQKKGWG